MADAGERDTPLLDRSSLERFRDRLRAADRLLLCLDFDGTLAPIVDDPADAAMSPANRELLQRLSAVPSVTVTIVSGRSLEDLRERVDIDGISYAGNHGLEWDSGAGSPTAVDIQETKQAIDGAVERLRSRLSDVPDSTVENKTLTATVHYRRVPDTQVPEVVEAAETVVASSDHLQCRSGKEIVEIRPDVQSGKDRIVRRLCDRYPDAVVVYVGDDVTDEDAFRAVPDGGFGILVGDRRETDASVRVPNTDGVTMLLAWLVHTYAESPDERKTTG